MQTLTACAFAIGNRYALVISIHKKALSLSQRAKLEISVGRIQNLMSDDCNTIINAIPMAHWWTW
jgi:hypothetical protein